MIKFPCTLCGSRNWPSATSSCPLCQFSDEIDHPEEDDSWDDESYDDDPE